MSDSTQKAGIVLNWDYSLAFLTLRLWLGVRALFAGIEKYGVYQSVATPVIDPGTGQPDASGVMVNVNVKHYAFSNYAGIPAGLRDRFAHEPLLAKFALTAFDHMLGPVLIFTGIMLLLGAGTRISLFTQAIVYVALTAGLILINQPDGIAFLGIHVGLIAAALMLANNNRFAVLKKW